MHTLESKCSVSIRYFPFDKQSCQLSFGLWTSTVIEILVNVQSSTMDLSQMDKNDAWDILSATGETIVGSVNSNAVYTINLQRKPEYYIYNIFLPVFSLSLLVVLTFLIPVESGDKMGYSMTVYLSFAIFLTIVSSSLPVSSETIIVSMYLIILLVFGTLVVVITAFQLRIAISERKVPNALKSMVYASKCLQCRRIHKKNTIQPDIIEVKPKGAKADTEKEVAEEVPENTISWSDVNSAIDYFMFFLFLIAICSITVVVFVYVKVSGANEDLSLRE